MYIIYDTHEVITEPRVQCSDVEVKSLVDQRSGFRLFGVQRGTFPILVGEIGDDGAGLPNGESIIDQRGHCVLGV